MNNEKLNSFFNFLSQAVSPDLPWPLKENSNGTTSIQQTYRNEMRRQGVNQLFETLNALLREQVEQLGGSIFITNDGIIISIPSEDDSSVVLNWEIDSTIKAVKGFDPSLAQAIYLDEQAEKNAKAKAKRAEEERKAAKRKAATEAANKALNETLPERTTPVVSVKERLGKGWA